MPEDIKPSVPLSQTTQLEMARGAAAIGLTYGRPTEVTPEGNKPKRTRKTKEEATPEPSPEPEGTKNEGAVQGAGEPGMENPDPLDALGLDPDPELDPDLVPEDKL